MAFSSKGRWFCPSCHQKKVQLSGRCWPRASDDPFPDYDTEPVMAFSAT